MAIFPYTFSLVRPFVRHENVTRVPESCNRAGEVSRPFPRTETGHLLFPHSDMKRHFYFCTAPPPPFLPSRSPLAGISMPHSVSGRVYRGVRGNLQYGYRSCLQRIPASPFLPRSPSFPSPFQFSVYSFPNRLARDSLSRTTRFEHGLPRLPGLPLCAGRYSLAILICACHPLVSALPLVQRIELRSAAEISPFPSNNEKMPPSATHFII